MAYLCFLYSITPDLSSPFDDILHCLTLSVCRAVSHSARAVVSPTSLSSSSTGTQCSASSLAAWRCSPYAYHSWCVRARRRVLVKSVGLNGAPANASFSPGHVQKWRATADFAQQLLACVRPVIARSHGSCAVSQGSGIGYGRVPDGMSFFCGVWVARGNRCVVPFKWQSGAIRVTLARSSPLPGWWLNQRGLLAS